MRMIVHAEDRSGRGDGRYTRPDADSALAIFFKPDGDPVYADRDGEEVMTREDAEAILTRDHAVEFYGEDGDKVTISRDWSTVP